MRLTLITTPLQVPQLLVMSEQFIDFQYTPLPAYNTSAHPHGNDLSMTDS
jgi:hypothetical protein